MQETDQTISYVFTEKEDFYFASGDLARVFADGFDKVVAFTGHRDADCDVARLDELLLITAESGYDTFLCGMAVGFDALAFDRVLAMKERFPHLKIVACVPCAEQCKTFSTSQRAHYYEQIKNADGVLCFFEQYNDACMHIRNRFMVDHSAMVIAYQRRNRGGTASTVAYAQKTGKPVLKV